MHYEVSKKFSCTMYCCGGSVVDLFLCIEVVIDLIEFIVDVGVRSPMVSWRLRKLVLKVLTCLL